MRCEIAFGVDARYVKYAGVAMTSAAIQSEGEEIGFHLVCDGIEDADRKRLEAFLAAFPWTDVHIYDADQPQRVHADSHAGTRSA